MSLVDNEEIDDEEIKEKTKRLSHEELLDEINNIFENENILENEILQIEKVLEEVLENTSVLNNNEIVLFNDDVNTFDHVIATLIRVCKHSAEQAEQCALLVHYKGKCILIVQLFKKLCRQKVT
jgi:ATP-dependent Clp protease adaptor protein ClpS